MQMPHIMRNNHVHSPIDRDIENHIDITRDPIHSPICRGYFSFAKTPAKTLVKPKPPNSMKTNK
jgi:hypothetical protein